MNTHDASDESDLDIFDAEHGDIAANPVVSLRSRTTPNGSSGPSSSTSPSNDHGFAQRLANESEEKAGLVDWHVEGQGRRVGYENLTAIDWIFEYTKERQRIRHLLATSSGLSGNLKQLVDASNVWFILVSTGLLTGLLAAFVSIASDWLGDIKTGYCANTPDATQFYLSKQFCCWGHDELTACQNWTPWNRALHISNIASSYVMSYIFFVLFAVVFAAVAALFVRAYAPFARQSGIPEIKAFLGGTVIPSFLSPITLLTKSIALVLSVSSGLWLGKEGPLVHLACCIADLVTRAFPSLADNEARRRELLSAAAASGISVAFGAPIGGVLFSLEQLAYYFPDRSLWQSFVCAMVAAVTLHALDPFHTGKIVLYQVTYTTGWHGFEMIPFIALGLIGGLFGTLFIYFNKLVTRIRRSDSYPRIFRNHPVLEVAVMAFVSAMINFPNLFMRAQLSELVYYLFAECATIGSNDIFGLCKVTIAGSLSMVSMLVTAAGLGTILAALTFGLPIPAGIILPSLAIGALYGRAIGVIVELVHRHHPGLFIFAACEPDIPCITPGTYAIVGAASALAGVTRMTASIVVIMFELTGALTYVLPIMIAVMLSKWIADALSGDKGIYETWIELNDYLYIDQRDDARVPNVPVATVMTRLEEMSFIDADKQYSVEDLRDLTRHSPYRGFPVLRTKTDGIRLSSDIMSNILIGYINRTELVYALETGLANLSPSANANTTLAYFHLSASAPSPQQSSFQSSSSIDLRPFIHATPLTLSPSAPLHLAVSMFQKLGLRYLLLVEQGSFRGLLTKKDIWWILGASEHQSAKSNSAHARLRSESDFVPGIGVLRAHGSGNGQGDIDEEVEEEQTGLLRDAG